MLITAKYTVVITNLVLGNAGTKIKDILCHIFDQYLFDYSCNCVTINTKMYGNTLQHHPLRIAEALNMMMKADLVRILSLSGRDYQFMFNPELIVFSNHAESYYKFVVIYNSLDKYDKMMDYLSGRKNAKNKI